MTYIITFICFLIALAIFAGAFYMARHHTRLEMRNDLLEENYKLATEHIGKQEEKINYLEQEVQHMQREAQLNGERTPQARIWNASDPLNSADRG